MCHHGSSFKIGQDRPRGPQLGIGQKLGTPVLTPVLYWPFPMFLLCVNPLSGGYAEVNYDMYSPWFPHDTEGKFPDFLGWLLLSLVNIFVDWSPCLFLFNCFLYSNLFPNRPAPDASMMRCLMATASSGTDACALCASTRHCLVSSCRVSMPSPSSSSCGKITVVGMLRVHATKTWRGRWVQQLRSSWSVKENKQEFEGGRFGSSTGPQQWICWSVG